MPDDPDSTVRDEAARQAIALVFGVAMMVIAAAAQRKATQPDAWRTERMRILKAAERQLAQLAAWSWQKAERARVAYERETS
jgi:hypothetical protein